VVRSSAASDVYKRQVLGHKKKQFSYSQKKQDDFKN
jgi:hypothetical protein